MAAVDTSVGHPRSAGIANDAAMPSTIPIMPPVKLSTIASITECDWAEERPDCHANTNLTRTFCDRHQHVFDADTAHQQRHTGNATQQPGHDAVRPIGSPSHVHMLRTVKSSG